MDGLAVDALEDHGQGRVGQDGPVREDAQERDPLPRQTALEGSGEARLGIEVDLVDDGPRDAHAVTLEQRGVEHDLVDRPSDAALGHDDRRRTEQTSDDRVGQPDDGPDTGVAGAFDEQDVALGREGRVGGPDARRQVLDDLALDVRLGEAARDVDRAHLGQRLAQTEDVAHQDRVLIGRDAVLDDRALADGLQEAARQSPAEEAVHDPEADRGLAPVLARRGQIDVSHPAGLAP